MLALVAMIAVVHSQMLGAQIRHQKVQQSRYVSAPKPQRSRHTNSHLRRTYADASLSLSLPAVMEFPFDDHNCPELHRITDFCEDVVRGRSRGLVCLQREFTQSNAGCDALRIWFGWVWYRRE